MNAGINMDVCKKIDCEHYEVWNDHCRLLLRTCTKFNQLIHHGCIIPDECLYKNFHIIDKSDVKSYQFEKCDECKYRPEEPK